MPFRAFLSILVSLLVATAALAQTPVGTAFTYQGRLATAGVPATGSYDLRFTLFDAPSAGNVVAGPTTLGGVAVSLGLFTVSLDFGAAAFAGQARWLAIEVQPTGGAGFTALVPRQALTPSPYTLFSSRTDPLNLTSLNASNLTSGAVPDARVSGTYSQTLNLSNAANTIAGTFTGSGFSLTSLNASNLASGTVPDARISGTYTNALTLSNPANAFTGNGSGLTNLNAQPRYVRTVVVSPVGTAAANGTALLQALAGITTASAANPWLLKIEPGTYAVGTTSFVMKPYVDVEGSGETVTKITGQGQASNSVGTVRGVTNSELRFLTVENTGGAAFAKPLLVDNAAPRITHVTLLSSGGSVETHGFWAQNGATPTVSDLTVSVSATGDTDIYGVVNMSASSVMFNVNVFSNGGATSQAVFNVDGATPTFRNLVAIASGGTAENHGVTNANSSPTMEYVVAVATGAASNNTGLLNLGGASTPSLRHVVCRGLGATNVNWGCLNNSGAQPTMVDIDAEAAGGTSARALDNSPGGAGLSLTRVRAVATGASSSNVGLVNSGGSPRIVDLTVFANGSGSASVFGIQVVASSPTLDDIDINAGGATSGIVAGIDTSGPTSAPTIAKAVVTASGSSTNTYAVWNENSTTPTLTGVIASSFGGGGNSYAVINQPGSQVSLTEVTATASGSAGTFVGIYNSSATVQLTGVIARGIGGGAGNRQGLFNDTGASTVSVDRSTLTGTTNSVLNSNSSVLRVGGSQLVGPVATISGATTSCVLSYNGSYAVLTPVCQ
jgi:hypothetical protein